jgi:hypothetical protein
VFGGALDNPKEGAVPNKTLSLGVSRQAKQRLQQYADLRAEQSEHAFRKDRKRVLDAVGAELKGSRQAFEQAVLKDAGYPDYEKQVAGIAGRRKPRTFSRNKARLRRRALRELRRKHHKLFAGATKRSGIKGPRIWGGYSKHLGSLHRHWCHQGRSFACSGSTTPADLEPLAVEPGTGVEVTTPFEAPYTRRQNQGTNGGAIDLNEVAVNAATGTLSMEGTSTAFGSKSADGSTGAEVGRFITLPAGFAQLRVTARIETHHEYVCTSGIGAQAFVNIRALVRLVGLNNEHELQSVELFMYLTTSSTDLDGDGDAEFLVSGDFAVPAGGGEFLVRAGGLTTFDTSISALGTAYPSGFRAEASAILACTVKQFSLEFLP